MTALEASAAWQSRQAQLLAATYRKGYAAGVKNYRAQQSSKRVQNQSKAKAAAAPAQPPAATISQALAPALSSLARMGAQIAVLVPSAAQIALAGSLTAATVLALKHYLQASGWLLAAGASVAWAGEQAGYAHAANADGFSLKWQLDPRAQHCDDCPELAALPPLPLGMWPLVPGEGLTDCSVGCRCALEAVKAEAPVLSADQEALLVRLANRAPVLVAA